MIGKLASLTASQRASFTSLGSRAKATDGSAPLESVTFSNLTQHRSPGEAIEFMERFDRQLGLTPELIAEKRELMAESSHTFFRASPALFYNDLHTHYKEASRLLPEPAPQIPILGDCHALNAGTFRGPDGKAVWGLNDFDQADVGSPEWDLERLAVSLYVGSRSNEKSVEESLGLVKTMAKTYLAHLGENRPAYLTEQESHGAIKDIIAKADSKTPEKLLKKWTNPTGDRLVREGKLEDIGEPRGEQVRQALTETFPDYTFLDTASKPHSGGSTRGMERYYSLVRTPDRETPWILETKAVLPSPVRMPDADLTRGDGALVLEYSNKLGGVVDTRHRAFQIGDIAFFTREREHEKDGLEEKQHELEASAEGIGRVLAHAHSRSGVDLKAWVAGREELLLDNLANFTRSYARQVESDFREWRDRYNPQ